MDPKVRFPVASGSQSEIFMDPAKNCGRRYYAVVLPVAGTIIITVRLCSWTPTLCRQNGLRRNLRPLLSGPHAGLPAAPPPTPPTLPPTQQHLPHVGARARQRETRARAHTHIQTDLATLVLRRRKARLARPAASRKLVERGWTADWSKEGLLQHGRWSVALLAARSV